MRLCPQNIVVVTLTEPESLTSMSAVLPPACTLFVLQLWWHRVGSAGCPCAQHCEGGHRLGSPRHPLHESDPMGTAISREMELHWHSSKRIQQWNSKAGSIQIILTSSHKIYGIIFPPLILILGSGNGISIETM